MGQEGLRLGLSEHHDRVAMEGVEEGFAAKAVGQFGANQEARAGRIVIAHTARALHPHRRREGLPRHRTDHQAARARVRHGFDGHLAVGVDVARHVRRRRRRERAPRALRGSAG